MTRIAVLGAGGRIAKLAVARLLEDAANQLTLYLRNPERLPELPDDRVEVIEGDVLDESLLTRAVQGQDVVYANLAGTDIEAQARAVVSALRAAGTRRLIWISTLGIYDEVPGEYGKWNHRMLDGGYLETYSAAARTIEESGLDYTIIRPAWLSDIDEVDYELTQKGQPFKGTEVSRESVAALVAELVKNPASAIGASLGVNKPGTDGDKPSWY
ncbi:SDR family oxidoreductase [Streptomyces sp. NPDC014748]|uniref:SDR family oxidoreductase n=1 Tax=Streptomyces sp. NPDC014748 TaxID=3364905 RepID=UPI0036F9C46D